MIKSQWLVLGAVVGCLSGASLAACGGTTATGTTGTGGGSTSGGGAESTTTAASTTGAGMGGAAAATASSSGEVSSSAASSGDSSSASSGAGGGGTGPCGTTGNATALHPPAADAGAATIFCPFSAAPGGKNLDCNHGTEHCCEPAMGTATCAPIATACAAAQTDWQCDAPADCPTGQVCCGTGTVTINPDAMCANKGAGFKGSHCSTNGACAPMGEYEMCDSLTGECPAGKTCTPFKTHGAQVGACL